MVRLKVRTADRAGFAQADFNSTMVRLKDTQTHVYMYTCKYFNSTMVRLKVGSGDAGSGE